MPDPRRLGIRINLTLPKSVVEQLDRMGAVTGTPRATTIRQWLVEATPALAEMATVMEMAQKNEARALKVIEEVMTTTSEAAGQLALEIKETRRSKGRRSGRAT